MSRYTLPTLAMLALGLSLAAAAAPGTLSVTFVHPESYTDASYHDSYGSDRQVLDEINRHLEKLAARQLPEGYTLNIEVLDIDLAGYVDWRSPSGLRIVRDVTWPKMTLHYVLRHGDQVVAESQDRLSNMNFHWGVNLYYDTDRLRYEKAMLDDWFGRTIVKRVG